MTGGHLSGRTGAIFSTMSAIRFGLSITTSCAFLEPRYANSSNISSVVLRYSGGWVSASANPFPAMIILRYISSFGSRKCTSHVATTGFLNSSPSFTIRRFRSLISSMDCTMLTRSLSIINALLPSG